MDIDTVVEFLNEALETDRDAIQALFKHRVPCNKAMAEHSTIQVRGKKNSTLGILGLINGIFGMHPGTNIGRISIGVYHDGKIVDFAKTEISDGVCISKNANGDKLERIKVSDMLKRRKKENQ